MMKKLYLLFILLLFTSHIHSQERNLRIVKQPTDNPTNQQRKAMVIGMSDYGAGRSLSNTLNDADDMANVLTKLGFKVTLLKNNDYRNLKNNLRDWYNTIEGNDMAIFYFAGHGMEVKGENYLIPIDAELYSEADVEDYTLKVNNVLGNMEERRVGMKLIILDACRDNPFKRSWSRGSEDKGLAQMKAPKGTYIAFAASPGNTAQDGGNYGLRNGVFTHYLKQEIVKEGASIDEIFNSVTGEVSNLTDDRQMPFKNSSLGKTFYFIPPNTKPTPDRPVPDNNNASDLLRKANTFFANEQYYDAFPLYLQAANAGNAGAQIKMGTCYANGFGIAKDHTQAVYWYRKAAEQNSDGAQYSLGVCYEKGLGVSKDKEEAIAWYKKAAKQGHSGAQDALERLQNTPTPVNTDGVVISGVRWATKNVGAYNPEDYGNYYNWEQAKTACPKGWRLPTKAEFESLINAGSAWITQNGKNGRKFGGPNNFVFFPAAGYRYYSDGTLSSVGKFGYYWSGTPNGTEDAYNVYLFSGNAGTDSNSRSYGFSVRCVSE